MGPSPTKFSTNKLMGIQSVFLVALGNHNNQQKYLTQHVELNLKSPQYGYHNIAKREGKIMIRLYQIIQLNTRNNILRSHVKRNRFTRLM